jgi:DNA polymerase III epsilon subunit-like protein
MTALRATLTGPGRRLVAHSAHTEATVISGYYDHCPQLTRTSLLCTVKLARHAWHELHSDRLDALLRFLRIQIPPGRHRGKPDAELTVRVFTRALTDGAGRGLWTTLQAGPGELDARAIAGVVADCRGETGNGGRDPAGSGVGDRAETASAADAATVAATRRRLVL